MPQLPEIDLSTRGWLSSRDAAARLDCSIGYLDRLVSISALTPYKMNGRRLFKETEIMEYKRSHPRLGSKKRAEAAA